MVFSSRPISLDMTIRFRPTHDRSVSGRADDLLTMSGMNVQVVDGSGDTSGVVNGFGNLIVGYNEKGFAATRTGSHNLVVGLNHEYTSYAGLVAGNSNVIWPPPPPPPHRDHTSSIGGQLAELGPHFP